MKVGLRVHKMRQPRVSVPVFHVKPLAPEGQLKHSSSSTNRQKLFEKLMVTDPKEHLITLN